MGRKSTLDEITAKSYSEDVTFKPNLKDEETQTMQISDGSILSIEETACAKALG